MKSLSKFFCILLALSFLGLAGCDNDGPLEEAGESLDEATESVEDEAEDVADEVEDAAE